jgi:hypothetical protein
VTDVVAHLYEDIGWLPNFFVYGLEQLANQGVIDLRRRAGFRAPITAEQRKWKSVLLQLEHAGRSRLMYIDMFDSADSLNLEVMSKVDRYFKVQYRQTAVDAHAGALAGKVSPTGFHFPVRVHGRKRVVRGAVRALRAALLSRRRPLPRVLYQDLKYSFQSLRRDVEVLPSYTEYTRTLADDPERVNDLFWNVTWWPPHLDPEGASASREAIMRILDEVSADPTFRLSFGFVDTPPAREHVANHVMIPTPSTEEYVKLVARSKMSIVPLGVQRCFSHRIGEHLALRRFAVMERFANQVKVPLVDGKHTVFYESDLSDLASKLRYYLQHDADRERIAAEGRRYFDEHCAPDRQVRWMIDETLAT